MQPTTIEPMVPPVTTALGNGLETVDMMQVDGWMWSEVNVGGVGTVSILRGVTCAVLVLPADATTMSDAFVDWSECPLRLNE